MKQLTLWVWVLIFVSCQPKKKESEISNVSEETTQKEVLHKYPEALEQVLEAHGGLVSWKKQRTLSFTIPKPDNEEVHTVDLKTRMDKIETPAYDIGFDGHNPWFLAKEGAFKGNAEFYHNLMFYFYAMPFVLADDGINYAETEPLEVEGVMYPGVKITYNEGVGTSFKDEYYLHYDANTYKMKWLGYTVTYRTGEKSEKVSWINYKEWDSFNGVVLPTTIAWHKSEGRKIMEERNAVSFKAISLSEQAKPIAFYAKPKAGEFYVKPE
ncbi:DUF6503 family protein [Flavobacterium sp. ASW18X]|uniref:DUF6503 family protein n=1 Tax=Flavobacterium sp. ASW18X TaxID=2572595 RepID=UPI0010AE566F|nr:DUF6503 family protein [Flavobacterium sp. ASW18X]TKD62456.1 hypothetical protein FBT53_09475 [Flavobacterium sp. ASW18X]